MTESHHDHQCHRLSVPDYLAAVQRSVVRALSRLGNRHAADAADDVAQEVVLALLAQPSRLADIMERYPNPVTYARVRASHAFLQWERAMRADRGEGAGLVVRSDGTLGPARDVVAGDSPRHDGEGNQWDHVAAVPDPAAELVEFLTLWPRAVDFLDTLGSVDREIVVLVLGFGFQVTEVAARLGMARETAARRLSRLRRRLDLVRANMVAEMSDWPDDKGTAA